MKIHNIFYSALVLLGITVAACDKDSFYEIPVGPPSDLQLTFSIAGDDSGLLTVFPEAVGAAYFDLYYGDGASAEPERVQAGQSGSKVYTEGTYTIRAVAYSLSGESIETTRDVNIQFTPPENLNVEVAVDPVNTNTITVTPTADNATLFEIYFGDVDDETPTNIIPGESAVHTYEESGTYTLRVVARSASRTTVEYTEELQIIKPTVQLALPIDFENPELAYAFVNFGGATLTVVDNPDQSGLNTSAKVGQLVKGAGAEVWAGGLLQLPSPINFNAGDQFSVKVWSPKSGAMVKLKVENDQDPNIAYEIDGFTQTSDAWETINFDFSGIDKSKSYHKVVIFMDFGNPGDDATYYFDEIVLSGENTALVLPIDFESDLIDYSFVDFGNAFAGRIDNPDSGGLNTSSKVGTLNKAAGAEVWAGSFLQLASPIDFAANDQLAVKTWSPKSGIVVKMKVENSANPDINYEVDVINTQANSWEELVYDFSGIDKSQSYDRVVLFFDFGTPGDDTDYYFDDIRQYEPASNLLELPLNFESDQLDYSFTDFGNAFAGRIDNPDPSGLNTSAKVGTLNKTAGAEFWAGSYLTLDSPIDFAANDQLAMKVWSPKSGIIVKIKVENSGNPDINAEVDVRNTQTNAWEELVYDFSGIDKSQIYDRVVVFFDFENPGDGTEYYFDDIRQYDGEDSNDPVLELPIDFESAELTYSFTTFGNVSAQVVDNPDQSGVNTSARVGNQVKPVEAESWGGAYLQLPEPIDFSSMDQIAIKTWSPKSGINVLLKLENATNGDIFHEIQVQNTVANAWETLTFDMSGIDKSKTYHKVVIFFDFLQPGDGSSYYFDDVELK